MAEIKNAHGLTACEKLAAAFLKLSADPPATTACADWERFPFAERDRIWANPAPVAAGEVRIHDRHITIRTGL